MKHIHVHIHRTSDARQVGGLVEGIGLSGKAGPNTGKRIKDEGVKAPVIRGESLSNASLKHGNDKLAQNADAKRVKDTGTAHDPKNGRFTSGETVGIHPKHRGPDEDPNEEYEVMAPGEHPDTGMVKVRSKKEHGLPLGNPVNTWHASTLQRKKGK